MVDEREGDVRRARPRRARSTARTCGSASRSSPRDRSPTCCSRCCCSPARTWPAFRDSARCSPMPRRARPPRRRAFAPATSWWRSTASRCSSWQDLRWRLTKAQGHDSVVARDRAAGPQRRRSAGAARARPSRQLATADWEGNALGGARPARRPRARRSSPRSSPGKPAERAGLAGGDRIVAIEATRGALAGRRRRDHQCPCRACRSSSRVERGGATREIHGHAGSAGAGRAHASASRA